MLGLGSLAKKIFGSSNDRKVKAIRPRSRRSTRSSPRFRALDDAELRAKTDEFRERAGQGRDPRRPPARGLRRRPRGRAAHAGPAPLRRAAGRRHGPARGRHRRDADRRRQDPGRHAARLSERADRQGRPRHHRQRLPGPARRRVDGPGLPRPRADRRRHRPRPARGASEKVAYDADITYGTNNEFGFDYLRDNLV